MLKQEFIYLMKRYMSSPNVKTKVCVSFLAFNEGATIKETLLKAYEDLSKLNLDFELWLFDNCSTDNTPEIASELKLKLERFRYYRQKENVGYAFSSLSSFKVPQADVYITLDGDGQFVASDVPKLLENIRNGSDFVVGYRKVRQDPLNRLVISACFNFVCRLLLRSPLHDMNCGFRALSKRAAESVEVVHQLKFVGPEIYVRAVSLGLSISEVVIEHFPRRHGQSVYFGLSNLAESIFQMLKYVWTLRRDLIVEQKKTIEQAKTV